MNITITGATGFIGRRLIERLSSAPHQLHALTRHTNVKFGDIAVWTTRWDPMTETPPPESVVNADAVIHLAGEPIAQRWTTAARFQIRESRVQGTRRLVDALSKSKRKPAVLVSGSAVGIYGSRGEEILTESSAHGHGYLAELCEVWENEAAAAESLGIRVVRIRTGVVLGKGGGALQKMLPPFKAFVGGKVGSGKQWMSWIQLDDLVGIICHALEHPMVGPVNGTAPNPVTNGQFTAELGRALGRPAVFPVPDFAIKALFGEMASVVLDSQRVLPKAAESAGYKFLYPELGPALRASL